MSGLAGHRGSTVKGSELHGDYEQEAGPASLIARETAPRASWDFTKIPIFAEDAANRPQARPSLSTLPDVIQTKLAVGKVNDPLESEADHAAERVMQRKCEACDQEDDKEGPVKLARAESRDSSKFDGGTAPAIVHDVLRSPGRALEPSTRAFFEPRFDHDFSHVRVHTDSLAAESARSVGALAYTVGTDIVFGSNQYPQQSGPGGRLLAHELAHTIQQQGGTPDGRRSRDDKPTQLMRQSASAPMLQRDPNPAETTLGSGEHKRNDKRYGRQLGQRDAARLRRKGVLSAEDRREINATLRSLEGEAKQAYIEEIRPALKAVTRRPPAPRKAADFLGSGTGPAPIGLLSADYSGPEVCGGQPCKTDAEIYAESDKSRAEDAAAEAKATAERKRRVEIQRHGTKQQKWELEFEIEYPELKNVGARYGTRDDGIMTDVGVRVPSDPKDFLTPRPFYERKSSAFLAYQGFIHYAELVEAGQDAQAMNLAQKINGGFPVPDDKLDLYGHTHFSRKMVASRKGLELGMLVANVAFAAEDFAAAMANRRGGPPTVPMAQLAEGLSNEARQALQRLGVSAEEIEQFASGTKVWGNLARGDAKLVPYFQREGRRLTAGILGAHSHLDRAGMIRAYLTFRQESMALAKAVDAQVLRLEADVVTNTDELLPELLKRGFQEIPDRPFSYFLDVPVK